MTMNIAKRPAKNSTKKKKTAKKTTGAPITAWANVVDGEVTNVEMSRSKARATGLGATKKVKLTFI